MTNLLQIMEPGQTPQPHATERKVAIGIDLGTTHSVAAMVIDGKPTVMRLDDGTALIPSAVSYHHNLIVGRQALGARNVLTSIKRLMGRGGEDDIVKHFPQAIPGKSEIVQLDTGAGRTVTPVQVSADILSHIKAKAEKALGESVEQAVITVPAYFDDAARTATRDAARLAGLHVLRLINEPTAAALAYGLENNVEGTYAVYDLGGGTFDISLLKLQKGVFQVLATGGDLALGGDDVDRALCTAFGVDPTPTALMEFRSAKEVLAEIKEQSVELEGKSYSVTREILGKVATPLIQRTLEICQSVLNDANCTPQDIKGVVLVGGSTRLQSVIDAVESFFNSPPLLDINPDEAVALGAAAQAHGLTEGSDNLLLDIIPLSLGLETMGGLVEKLLHRNSPIPAMAKQEFTTYQNGQTGLVVHVVQGEREFVHDCRSLAKFELVGIPPMPAGVARIEIKFNVDADGLLTVSAKELTTGVSQHVEVKPSYGLSSEQMANMLESSMMHGREDMKRRLLEEAKVDAERLIHDVTIALDKDGDLLDEAETQTIQNALEGMSDAITSEQRERILESYEVLDQASQGLAEKRINQGMKEALVGSQAETLDKLTK